MLEIFFAHAYPIFGKRQQLFSNPFQLIDGIKFYTIVNIVTVICICMCAFSFVFFFMISNTFEVTINFLWNGCVNFKRSYLFLKRKHRTLIALWLYSNVIFLTKNTLNTFNHYIERILWFWIFLFGERKSR